MSVPPSTAAGWYPDPQNASVLRWWDGTQWGDQTTPASAAPGFARGVMPAPVVVPGSASAFAPTGSWRSPVDNRPYVADMAAAVRVVLGKYAEFNGRASRSEYWYFYLAVFVLSAATAISMLIPFIGFVIAVIVAFGSLALIVPALAVCVRRLRDAGYAWPWIFVGLVPLGGIALLVFLCMPSKYP